MSDNRITTIVTEIKYWKDHKLLPDYYCDFLLALYTNGENDYYVVNDKKVSKINILFQSILIILLLPFSFLVIYFTKFPDVLQLGILILFLGYSFWGYLFFKKQTERLYHIPLIIFLILLLLLTVFFGGLISHNDYIVYGTIIINFCLWFIISKKNHIKYLSFTSVFGILFSIFYIVL